MPRLILLLLLAGPAAAADRPHVLWLTSEDHGPQLGCYGDAVATTPHADALAKRGMRYTRCWSNYPVCAPARTTLIAGLYAHSSGGEHMRSMVPFPAGKQMFPQLLRAAGYYCTNNAKEDYNLSQPGRVWDASSAKAHYRDRPAGAPFFAVFNSVKSHESQVRRPKHTPVHEPAKVRVPAYHPDTPEVRKDWAQYYDVVSEADADAGDRLAELAKAGLADDTIVFYFADHGPGMPRSKRWPYNSGLHVPLIVHVPEKWRHLAGADYKPGGTSDRLVSFVDFGPTVLSLAGIEPPAWMQGRAFLGKHTVSAREFNFGARGRMDERTDLVRTATDGRHVYVRNYLPHLIYGQHVGYMFEMPTTRVWKERYDAGKLNAAQSRFWGPKPAEELYDLSTDPDEVTDLASAPTHRATLEKLRAAVRGHCREVRDLGFLPEGERFRRADGKSPYDLARHSEAYPFDRVFDTAERAAGFDATDTSAVVKDLADVDPAVRCWGAVGLQVRGKDAVMANAAALRTALDDKLPQVRIAAAEALGRFGSDDDLKRAVEVLVKQSDPAANDVFTVMAALQAVDAIRDRSPATAAAVKALRGKVSAPHQRYGEYVPRLLQGLDHRADRP